MPISKVISDSDAVQLIQDGDAVATSGYGGHGVPEQVLMALEDRYTSDGSPTNLTLVFAGGQGDGRMRGLNHLGHEGLLRRVIGGHYGLVPKIAELAVAEKLEAYNFPEGVLVHLYRTIAAGAPGLLSCVGLRTFVDPRLAGGKVNASATEDLVELSSIGGEEWLFYRSFPIDVALIRGTTADPEGNTTMEREALNLEALSLAIAAKTSGGIVICQVERVAEVGSLDSRLVRIPGVLVDAVVVADASHHMQTFGTQFSPAMSGEIRVPVGDLKPLPLDHKKVIARRAALELKADTVVNLGIGLPDLVGRLVGEEGVEDLATLTVDPGVIGGVPQSGLDFGGAVNHQAVIDHAAAFDFIDGGGLDAVFLGVAQIDGRGDVNVSRFSNRLTGCGGFINLTQRTMNVVFLTTFTSGGLKTVVGPEGVEIVAEGTVKKFVSEVEQITFSGDLAHDRGQNVLIVTERCVLRLEDRGLTLVEIAPGIDLQRQILDLLPFEVRADDVKEANRRLYASESLGLRSLMLDTRVGERLSYDADSNTVFMDYSGMHIRTNEDIEEVVAAVDALLGPLGRRVNSIVNYDRFKLDEEVADRYADAVEYVSSTYYDNVSRHSTSGFTRLKLGRSLERRSVEAGLYESESEALDQLDR
ncbi:MAG: acyl CoA:acetate/3-ketoacid CoA transferase [Acidimicrobiia bacterium]|nr:MAG: acyl CoA:acetate/3-ketoacid CoA transferase [Acidimicrobiia bacterium]